MGWQSFYMVYYTVSCTGYPLLLLLYDTQLVCSRCY